MENGGKSKKQLVLGAEARYDISSVSSVDGAARSHSAYG